MRFIVIRILSTGVLPEWLVAGLQLSALASVLIVAVFVVGVRLFPTRPAPTRYSGTEKRRGEIRAYLTAIGERFLEDHAIDGERVDFYLPDRDVAVTFDARTYVRIDGSATYPVLVEHELPGNRLGGRLPFETPESGPTVETAMASFALLEIPVSADPDEIRAAYRERIKEVHPDHGGDVATFNRVREAYTRAKRNAR